MADFAYSTSAPARRSFLRGLASLPLIGGSLALIGKPTAAATPVTDDLLFGYKNWLYMEHRMLSFELVKFDYVNSLDMERTFPASITDSWHAQWFHKRSRGMLGWETAPQPSTRAAVVLAAAGVPLTGSSS